MPTTQPPLGYIASEVHIFRPPGDPAHPLSWPFPLITETARGASMRKMVTGDRYPQEFIDEFIRAGKALAARGAVAIVTACGFLVGMQDELSKALPIPIATSSLLLLPTIRSILPSHLTIGVLTFSSPDLTPKLSTLQLPACTIIGFPPTGHLHAVIRDGAPYVREDLEKEVAECARELKAQCGGKLGAVLLECTQLPCFRDVVRKETGVMVWDVINMGESLYKACLGAPSWEMQNGHDGDII